MARVDLVTLTLDNLTDKQPLDVACSNIDDVLQQSIAKQGLLQPILVAQDGWRVIDGLNRLACCRHAGFENVQALQIQGKVNDHDLFLMRFVANWKRDWTECEQALICIKAMTEFGFLQEEVIEEVGPLLGLKLNAKLLRDYHKISKLHELLLSKVAHEEVSLRGAVLLSRLTKDDQSFFVSGVLPYVSLSANQLVYVSEWLFDMLSLSETKISLQDFLKQRESEFSLVRVAGDRRQVASKWVAYLRRLRFPDLVKREDQFSSFKQEIENHGQGLSLETPSSFEEEGYILKARIPRAESLDRLLAVLKSKRKELNSLFDIVL